VIGSETEFPKYTGYFPAINASNQYYLGRLGAQERKQKTHKINKLSHLDSIEVVFLKENAAADGPRNGVKSKCEAAEPQFKDIKTSACATSTILKGLAKNDHNRVAVICRINRSLEDITRLRGSA